VTQRKRDARTAAHERPVSVVIPSYNRANQLRRVLGSYLKQSGVKEVIVVDDGSTDRTPELLHDWAGREERLRSVRLNTNRGQAGARNTGARLATGDFIFYGEDDYELTPRQVPTLLDHLERTDADLIAGRRINVLPGESYRAALRRVSGYADPLIERWAIVGNHHVDTQVDVEAPLLDACALVRREVFKRCAFDVGFRGNGWREESDFQLSALEAGFKLVHCPHTLGFHYPGAVGSAQGGAHSRSRLAYELWVVRNNGRFMRKHWEFLRSGQSELQVAPVPEVTLAVQTVLRTLRAGKKISRLAAHRLDPARYLPKAS
jgi:glycosyltransferase involved in cell wall biosynthesis